MAKALSQSERLSRRPGETARVRVVLVPGDTIANIIWPNVPGAVLRSFTVNYDNQWAEAIYQFPQKGRYEIVAEVTTAGTQEIRPTWTVVVA